LLGAGSAKSVCKILMSKSLEVKILTTKNLGRRYVRSAHRLGLDHDRAGSMGGTRSDITLGVWIYLYGCVGDPQKRDGQKRGKESWLVVSSFLHA
jgi:hypothetical protein